MIGKSVKFKSVTSLSRSIKVALSFAFKRREVGWYPVIFVVSCSNYLGILGMAMNNEAYTAYPYEGEILLMDGATVNVWDVETSIVINNKDPSMIEFDGLMITYVHLFHAK